MSQAVFTYPGGKSQYADWIVSSMPEHGTYVEVFGGSGAVLLNKERSTIEVFNDVDSDITHFFETLRDHSDEMVEYLSGVPFSKDLYEKWTRRYYEGWRPNDDVKRASVFFFNRYAQWGGKYEGISGFARSANGRNKAETWARKKQKLEEFSKRWESVLIDNLDYSDILEKYDDDNSDGEGTLFYCDPPYVDTEHRYDEGDETELFVHEVFVDKLLELDADWIVSYGTDLPVQLEQEQFRVDSQTTTRGIDRAHSDGKKAHERLVKNYPENRERDFQIGGTSGSAMEGDW